MSKHVHITTLQVLDDLRNALVRFRAGVQEAHQEMEAAIRRVEHYLEQRERHWRREIERREKEYRLAQRAYEVCRSRTYRDSAGRTCAPDCSQEEKAMLKARMELERAQANYREVQSWKKMVRRETESYRNQARRMSSLLESSVPQATAWLQAQAATLQSYIGLSALGTLPLGAPPSLSSDSDPLTASPLVESAAPSRSPAAMPEEDSPSQESKPEHEEPAPPAEPEPSEPDQGALEETQEETQAPRTHTRPAAPQGLEREPGPEAPEGGPGSRERLG